MIAGGTSRLRCRDFSTFKVAITPLKDIKPVRTKKARRRRASKVVFKGLCQSQS